MIPCKGSESKSIAISRSTKGQWIFHRGVASYGLMCAQAFDRQTEILKNAENQYAMEIHLEIKKSMEYRAKDFNPKEMHIA